MQKPWRVSLAGLCWRPQVFLPCRTVADGQIIVATFCILLAPLLLGLLALSLSGFAPFVIFDSTWSFLEMGFVHSFIHCWCTYEYIYPCAAGARHSPKKLPFLASGAGEWDFGEWNKE